MTHPIFTNFEHFREYMIWKITGEIINQFYGEKAINSQVHGAVLAAATEIVDGAMNGESQFLVYETRDPRVVVVHPGQIEIPIPTTRHEFDFSPHRESIVVHMPNKTKRLQVGQRQEIMTTRIMAGLLKQAFGEKKPHSLAVTNARAAAEAIVDKAIVKDGIHRFGITVSGVRFTVTEIKAAPEDNNPVLTYDFLPSTNSVALLYF